jgi:hypothetical protein
MKSFRYDGIPVQQRPDSAPFYMVSARATEILEWADVPRKKTQYMAGYQRELDDRHKRIREFLLKDSKNVIPAAVIIAVRRENIKVTPSQGGICQIEISTEDKPLDVLISSVYAEFLSRLSESEKASISTLPAETPEEELEESDDDESDSGIPESYMARLTRELQEAKKNKAALSEERMQEVEDFVRGVTKPGLILDGQHRVFGAKNVDEFPVFLPVIIMPGLEYAEQVFHFYVLNNKAKPLKPTELRATISTSLTKGEIDSLYKRLRQAGVKAEEARWTHEMDTNPRSPFRGMINFGLENGGGVISENVAFQIASAFLKPTKKRRALTRDVPKWDDDEYKLALFFRFWQAIAEKYPKAWAEGVKAPQGTRPIFYKATMVVLQDYLLEKLVGVMPSRAQKNQPSPFADPDDLAGETKSWLFYLPEEFFLRQWQETGLDTPERRKFLKGQIEDVVGNQGERLGYMPLFRKKG